MPLWIPWFFFLVACVVAFIQWDEARFQAGLLKKERKHNEELFQQKLRLIEQLNGHKAKAKRVLRKKAKKR